MKAGMLAIRPWLSCQYNENMLVDLPSSVVLQCLSDLWHVTVEGGGTHLHRFLTDTLALTLLGSQSE